MSVTRINTFQAREGKCDALRGLLESVLPSIQSSPGCLSCQLLQSQEDPVRLVVLEVWDRVESHAAAIQAIPEEAFAGVMDLLDGVPTGEYFSECGPST